MAVDKTGLATKALVPAVVIALAGGALAAWVPAVREIAFIPRGHAPQTICLGNSSSSPQETLLSAD